MTKYFCDLCGNEVKSDDKMYLPVPLSVTLVHRACGVLIVRRFEEFIEKLKHESKANSSGTDGERLSSGDQGKVAGDSQVQ